MNSVLNKYDSMNRQRGATLIVSLVILAIITMLGIASMRSSNLELKMAASARDRAVALEAAESALRTVEADISNAANDNKFGVASFLPGCSGDNCFTKECTNGRCFGGDMNAARTRDDCRLANRATTDISKDKVVVKQYWNEKDYWDLETKYSTSKTTQPGFKKVLRNNGSDKEAESPSYVRYLIEFMCFVPKDDAIVSIGDTDYGKEYGVPLFQITVRAQGEFNRSTVMLQSIFRGAK